MSWAGRPLAIAGAIAATVASAVVVGISMSWSPRPDRAEGSASSEWSLRGVLVVAVLFGIPILLAVAGALMRTGRAAQVVRILSGVVLGMVVLFFAFGGGVFYIPASLLMLAAGVLTDVDQPRSSPG